VVDKVLSVHIVAQQKTMSCWAAAAAMLLKWRNPILDYSDQSVAELAGEPYRSKYNSNTGLSGAEIAAFANAMSLVAEPPQNYTVNGYVGLLAKGPLWVGAGLMAPGGPRAHVLVLYGLRGDGSADGTTAWVADPDGGADRRLTFREFVTALEAIAKAELATGADFFPQVIRLA
jgi:hypothetical protein